MVNSKKTKLIKKTKNFFCWFTNVLYGTNKKMLILQKNKPRKIKKRYACLNAATHKRKNSCGASWSFFSLFSKKRNIEIKIEHRP